MFALLFKGEIVGLYSLIVLILHISAWLYVARAGIKSLHIKPLQPVSLCRLILQYTDVDDRAVEIIYPSRCST